MLFYCSAIWFLLLSNPGEKKKKNSHTMFVLYEGRQAGRQAGNMYPGWKAFVIESFFFWFSLQIIISSPCRATETYVIAFWSLFAPFLAHNLINFGTFLTREKCTKTEMCASGIVSICRIDMIAQMFHSNWNESIYIMVLGSNVYLFLKQWNCALRCDSLCGLRFVEIVKCCSCTCTAKGLFNVIPCNTV